MAEIELVIKISEKLACEGFERTFTEEEKSVLIRAIGNGTPLPKRHGNLFDENDFEKRVAIMTESMDLGYGEIMDIIDEIPIIIGADKTESEE